MSSDHPDPETFQTDASHPLQGISLIGIDQFIKTFYLPKEQKLDKLQHD
jgi:hypothetical protein